MGSCHPDEADSPARPTSVTQLWHSANDFSGPAPPRLNPWEQLAQALFVSNEFVFVD